MSFNDFPSYVQGQLQLINGFIGASIKRISDGVIFNACIYAVSPRDPQMLRLLTESGFSTRSTRPLLLDNIDSTVIQLQEGDGLIYPSTSTNIKDRWRVIVVTAPSYENGVLVKYSAIAGYYPETS
ncbi:MAG: hypothetical protein KGI08_10610 [Thaumarchaeota archaeon]|nr:hypothetical protein [Nitrososphaerota archaeon]